MRVVTLESEDDFEGWRRATRALVTNGVAPDQLVWRVAGGEGDLFQTAGDAPLPQPRGELRVPRGFPDLAQLAILHRDPQRFALLHTLLDRIAREPRLLDDATDPLVRRVVAMARTVRRDLHKMRAFLRFREVAEPDGATHYVAWFEPEHHIVRTNARFFVDRFATMRWSILTPELSLHWDGAVLSEGPGATPADAAEGDPVEAVWKTYYAAIFNPARVKVGAMLKEMPRKYWKNMPETALVPELIAQAQMREQQMVARSRTAPGGNADTAWDALRAEAAACTRCALYRDATQTVFGEGPVDAALMLVGEQPGDQEDLAGQPFVGPAGQVLDRALAAAGIDRGEAYVTNAVKHFKFEQRGKRRIHAKPDAGEIAACRWWLEQEMLLVRPRVTVALGATAARALLGKTVTIGRERGRAIALDGGAGWVTVHPSYLLRIPERDRADAEFDRFVADLRGAKALLD